MDIGEIVCPPHLAAPPHDSREIGTGDTMEDSGQRSSREVGVWVICHHIADVSFKLFVCGVIWIFSHLNFAHLCPLKVFPDDRLKLLRGFYAILVQNTNHIWQGDRCKSLKDALKLENA